MSVVTNHQYEAPILPTSWTGDEKKFYTRLIDVLDEIYSKYGRLSLKDLSPAVRKQLSELVDNTTFETVIEQTEREIRLKADASTVDTLGQTVSSHSTQIQQNASAIALKASQSSVDSLTGRVSSAETSLTLKADQATLTSTANGLQSQIDAVPGKITLAVNNVQVGGTNLLLGTGTAKVTTGLNGSTNQASQPYNLSDKFLSATKNGKQITLSFDWVTTASSGTVGIQTFGAPWGLSGMPAFTISANSGHYAATVTATSALDVTTYTGIRLRFDNVGSSSNVATFTWSNVKLEWGNKATSWSPAPEDTDAAIDAVNTQLSLVPGEITAAVSNVSVGGTNLLRYSKEVRAGSGTDLWNLSTNVSTYADADLGYTIIWINQSGATSNVWRRAESPVINLGADWVGKQVTISGWVYSPNYTAIDSATFIGLYFSQGAKSRLNWVEKTLTIGNTNQWGPEIVSDAAAPVNGKIHRFSITITLSASVISSGTGVFEDNTVMWAIFTAARNADLRFYGLKAEWGNKATAWSPAPEDPSSGVVNNSITIDTEGIKMSSSDVFQLVAANASKNSIIDIHGLFTADNTGGLTAARGSFADSLTVGGQRVLTLSDIGIPIKVSTSQPSGHGFIWLQPSSVTSVRYTGYTADSRNSTVMFSTSQRTITRSFAAEASNTLANGTFTYTLTFEVMSLSDAQLTGVTFSASATKSSTVSFSASSAITLTKYQTATITLTATSSTNLASNANAISVAITATASSYGGLYLNSKQWMTLIIAKSGGSGTQGCNVYYIP